MSFFTVRTNRHQQNFGEGLPNNPSAVKLIDRVSDARSATRILKQKSKRCRMVRGRRRGMVASIRWMNQGMPRQALFNQWGQWGGYF